MRNKIVWMADLNDWLSGSRKKIVSILIQQYDIENIC